VPRPEPQPGVRERFDLELDITAALDLQAAGDADVSLKLVAVDASGHEVPAEAAILEETVVEIE